MLENVTVVIPSHNTLNHLKNTYASIRKYYKSLPLIVVDDASTDGTDEWLSSLVDDNLVSVVDKTRRGHTFWYDEGMRMSKTDIVAILHSDMIVGPNYFENLLKHLKPKTVVCATRIEPPIHPAGFEKIVENFGMDYFDIAWERFEEFCLKVQKEQKDVTTRGIFAPWILFKEDHLSIGGHDQNFAPYGYEDSDIFNRWILAGYEMVQSRDSLVYHLTCRGHRWNKGVGIDNPDYAYTMERGRKYFLRKWNQWIQNDEYQHPIIYPKYNVRAIVKNLNDINLLKFIEPLVCNVVSDSESINSQYIQAEQPHTKVDMANRISLGTEQAVLTDFDINVIFDGSTLSNEDINTLRMIGPIVQQLESDQEGDVAGTYELGNIVININKINDISKELVCV